MKAVAWDVPARQDSVLQPRRGGPAAIAVRDLRKSYGDLRAVDGVAFEVGQGEFFGILGPNGTGKTTTLEIIEGLRQAGRRRGMRAGHGAVATQPGVAARIGVQLQASSFFEHLSAREQLRTFAALYGVLAGRADSMLELVGMSDSAATRTEKLSGGQAQRLSIACALVHGVQDAAGSHFDREPDHLADGVPRRRVHPAGLRTGLDPAGLLPDSAAVPGDRHAERAGPRPRPGLSAPGDRHPARLQRGNDRHRDPVGPVGRNLTACFAFLPLA
jgi:ABC-type transport system involved in cytochrome c biogenesis ATPase subunit